MLKIREYDDNGNKIDLKVLEKFGFIIYHYSWGTVYERPLKYPEYSTQSIYIDINMREIDEEEERYNVVDAKEEHIQDIIKANLVEKVSGDNE